MWCTGLRFLLSATYPASEIQAILNGQVSSVVLHILAFLMIFVVYLYLFISKELLEIIRRQD